MKYIAAAYPQAILALLEERERLRYALLLASMAIIGGHADRAELICTEALAASEPKRGET